jgi:aspartate dehydrogenase
MKTVALLGCGNLGRIVAKGIVGGLAGRYRLTAVYDVNPVAVDALAAQCSCEPCHSLDELLAGHPDYVVEAAGPAGLKASAIPVLRAGSDLVILSVGAFADGTFYDEVRSVAEQSGSKVHVVSGAIGGFDVMQAAKLVGSLTASIANVKGPQALEGAPILEGRSLPSDKVVTVFSGNAKAAIEAFPHNVNVAVGLALATVGVDRTAVEVVSEPGRDLNSHRITLEGDFGRAYIEIESKPSPDNPRSSAIAAYAVLAKLKNLDSSISFC